MQLSIQSIERAGRPEPRGPKHSARLVIPPENVAEHSPFLLMAEDWFAPPAGFPTHPHRGIETVTFVISGQMLHEDHTGGAGRLNAGDAQFMTAGGGVMHSEMPGPDGVRSLQLWLNLPATLKRTPARYKDVRAADAPTFRGEGVEARVYSGKLGDIVVPESSIWPLTMIDARLEAGSRFRRGCPGGLAGVRLCPGRPCRLRPRRPDGGDRRSRLAGGLVERRRTRRDGARRRAAPHHGEPSDRRARGDGRPVRHEHKGGDSRGLRRSPRRQADRADMSQG